MTTTFFSRSALPTNLLSVQEWTRFAEAVGLQSWESGMARYAQVKGGAIAMRADGTLRVLTRLASGKLRRTTYKLGTWNWAD